MSPNSASRAEKLGYTNVKVYHDGIPVWTKQNYLVISPKSLKEGWMDKDMPNVLVDVRSAKEAVQGFIKGAVTLPAAEVAANLAKFPPKEKKPPIIIYDRNGGDEAKAAAKTLVAAGYPMVDVLTGGFEAWKAASYPVETGTMASAMTYVPKPRPGEIATDEFKKIALEGRADSVILDVRNRDEAAAGMIKGAINVPDEEVLDRLAELPKDKLIIAHCNTGVRAEMTYNKLKDKGYNVKYLNATVSIAKDGSFTIDTL